MVLQSSGTLDSMMEESELSPLQDTSVANKAHRAQNVSALAWCAIDSVGEFTTPVPLEEEIVQRYRFPAKRAASAEKLQDQQKNLCAWHK